MLLSCGTYGNVIRVLVPLTAPDAIVDEGLAAQDAPDAVLGNLPLVYPFIVNDPGEGTQAKRRAHATIIDHLIPPMARADTYGDLARLEQHAGKEGFPNGDLEALHDLPGPVFELTDTPLVPAQRSPVPERQEVDVGPSNTHQAKVLSGEGCRLGVDVAVKHAQGGVVVHGDPGQGGLSQLGDEFAVSRHAPK